MVKKSEGSAFFLLLLLYNIVLNFVFAFLFVWLRETFFNTFFFSTYFLVLTQLLGFVLPLVLWLKFKGEPLRLPNMKLGNINILLITLLSIFLQPFIMLVSALSALFFPNPVSGALNQLESEPFAALLIALAVTPAFCEEIVFRGFLLDKYRVLGIKKAAVITGLFFGIAHLNPQQFLYAFIIGMIFAYYVYYTRSIRAGILAHFLMNAIQLTISRVITVFAASEAATHVEYINEYLALMAGFGVMTLIFVPAFIILFRVFISHNNRRNLKYDLNNDVPLEIDTQKPLVLKDPFLWCAIGVYILYAVSNLL